METVLNEAIAMDDGALLHTTTQGRGRPVVLCHGGPGGTDTLGGLATMLSGETGFIATSSERAVDLPEGRRSPWPAGSPI
jgi:proline iminopeptidase